MIRNLLMVGVWASLAVSSYPVVAAEQNKRAPDEPLVPQRASVFMMAKLEHAKKVLEGLTTENFDLIAKHSQAMGLLSHEQAWRVLQTEEYLQRSVEFRRSIDTLTDAAKHKNLDGATVAYVDATLKCVECHKYVRRVRQAAIPAGQIPGGRLVR